MNNLTKNMIAEEIRGLGYNLSNTREKKMKRQELMVLLEELKGKTPELMVEEEVQSEEIADPIAVIFNKMLSVSKATTLQVNTHTTTESDRVITALKSEIEALKDMLKNPAVNGQTTRNPQQNTTVQYNQSAATIKPIGTVRNNKGKFENYFAVCGCGRHITSARVVAYSKANLNGVYCWECQKKLRVNGKQNNMVTNDSNNTVAVKCSHCNTVKYRDKTKFAARAKWATENNLPMDICNECAMKIKQSREQVTFTNQNPPVQNTPSAPEGFVVPEGFTVNPGGGSPQFSAEAIGF